MKTQNAKRKTQNLVDGACGWGGGLLLLVFIVCAAIGGAARGADQSPQAKLLDGVGIDQKMGSQVPMDLQFRDENGNLVRLKDLQRGKPIILSLVYLKCPMLCTLVLNDLLSTVKTIPQTAGDEYDIWTVSFDPKEGPAIATEKKEGYLDAYSRVKHIVPTAGWRFLTGDEENIKKLTDAVGFHYRWDEKTQQYIHPAGIMILTPGGKIARYFFGIDYDPTDIRLSLVEASANKIATPTDRLLLFCYHYDPRTGKYGLAVANTLRAGGALTLLLLGGMLFGLWRFDQRRTRRLMAEVPREEKEGVT
ncbi:MAG: SCO family protein [Phycisphaerae bacterium]